MYRKIGGRMMTDDIGTFTGWLIILFPPVSGYLYCLCVCARTAPFPHGEQQATALLVLMEAYLLLLPVTEPHQQ